MILFFFLISYDKYLVPLFFLSFFTQIKGVSKTVTCDHESGQYYFNEQMCSKHYAEYNAFFQLAYIKKISKCASYLLHQDRVFFFFKFYLV